MPPSRKNSKRELDGEMKPTKKGKQWHCGMKLHVGVDEESGLIHSMESTSANLHDLTPSAKLLHGAARQAPEASPSLGFANLLRAESCLA